MPQFLTRSAVRLLEASLDSLSLAMLAATAPVRHVYKSDAAGAGAIGMAATSAEQVMASILVQVEGDDAILREGGKYKTAAEVLFDIRRILTAAPVARATYLTSGVADPSAHRAALHAATGSFRLLMSSRASALHGGVGLDRAVVVHAIRQVHGFMRLLGESTRIRPYIASLPELPEPSQEQYVLLDELASRFEKANSVLQQGALVRQLFLVLPELPPDPPEWLDAFDRVSVVPAAGDVRLLVSTLQAAEPVRLARLSGGGALLTVRISSEPGALPIEPQALRTSFTRISDQIGADIATANGRLGAGTLDLPPPLTAEMMALGDRELSEQFGGWPLIPHKAWPFIARALSERTPQPHWFLVRKVEDLGQLKALLRQVASVARGRVLAGRINGELVQGIDAIIEGAELPPGSSLRIECGGLYRRASEEGTRLLDAIDRNLSDNQLDAVAADAIHSFCVGMGSATESWTAIEAFVSQAPARRRQVRGYWARRLAESVTEPNDVPFLSAILRDRELGSAHTAVRKALRMIDVMTHGPSMSLG